MGGSYFILTPRDARAQTVIYPASDAKRINTLAFAPDGQSLWSINEARQLTIIASDGKSETYGALEEGWRYGDLKVFADNSFLANDLAGTFRLFEPPVRGQPLRLRREFAWPKVSVKPGEIRQWPGETIYSQDYWSSDNVISGARRRRRVEY